LMEWTNCSRGRRRIGRHSVNIFRLTFGAGSPYGCQMQSLSGTTAARLAVPPSPARCAEEILNALPQVMWFIRREMRRNRTRGLSIPQFRTLVLIDDQPTASLSTVAEHLGASLPTASRIVSGLVGKGLIARDTCTEDRRQCSLRLTATGRAALNAGRRATQERLAGKLASVGERERAVLVDAMKTLDAVFGKELPQSAGDNAKAG
jgi:DNA-binding MarR family transcriptional regulator